MAIASKPKKPWIAALLALALGGPGCFYLGWKRGVKATLAWLLIVSFLVGVTTVGRTSFVENADLEPVEPATLFVVLLHGALAWVAYRTCNRASAQAAEAADPARRGVGQLAQADCSRKIKEVGQQLITLSGLTLLVVGGAVRAYPKIGGMGHFTHEIFAPCVLSVAVWGLATGLGLLCAWRWAWISMLVFGGLMASACSLLAIPPLLMSGGGIAWWNDLGLRAFGVLLFALPAAIGVRWFRFFLRGDVKSYFGISRNAGTTPA